MTPEEKILHDTVGHEYFHPGGMVYVPKETALRAIRQASKNFVNPVGYSLAVEFGYKQCEKGNNLEHTLIEFEKLSSNLR